MYIYIYANRIASSGDHIIHREEQSVVENMFLIRINMIIHYFQKKKYHNTRINRYGGFQK